MSDIAADATHGSAGDLAPGQRRGGPNSFAAGLRSYLIGLALAAGLTFLSFWAAQTNLIYAPGVSAALITLGIAQMGIHLVFFLHITTAADNANNVLALAFGILIVFIVIVGSLWIMADLNHMTVSADQMMRMQP